MTPRDRRQYGRMLDVVRAVRTRTGSLVEAADALLFLQGAVEDVDPDWAFALLEHVATLESAGVDRRGRVLAPGVSADRNGDALAPGVPYPDFVVAALDGVEGLVTAVLAGHPAADEDAE